MKPSFDFVEVAEVRRGRDISQSALKGEVDYSLSRWWIWECYSRTIKYRHFEPACTRKCDNGGSFNDLERSASIIDPKTASQILLGLGGVFDLTKTFTALGKVRWRPLPSLFTPYIPSGLPPLGLRWRCGRARHHLGKRQRGTDTFQISILMDLKGIYVLFENYFVKSVPWLLKLFACFGSKSNLIII